MLETISILYVEDDVSISEEIVFFLSKKVKTLHVAYNGKEGLELFQKFKPDIIITDIEMPELNGLDMVKKIKQEDTTTPIIVTSAFSETDRLLQSIELGIDSYLIKPINLKALLQKIEILTKKSQKTLDEKNILLSLFDKGESVLFKWRNDRNWTIDYVSSNVEKLLPGSLNRLNSGYAYASYIHKDDLHRISEEVKTAMKEGKDFINDQMYRIVTSDNEVKWVVNNAVSKKDANGQITHFIGSVTNITTKRNLDKKVDDYLTLIDEHVLTTSTDVNGVITDVSSAFCELCGYAKEELIGKTHSILRADDTKDRVHKDLWETITEDEIYSGEIKNKRKDGSSFWIKITILQIINEENVKTGYLSIKQNITDKKIIEELSITDDLTKLYNRRHFNETFTTEIARAKRDKKCIAFIMLDIDKFKLYNDTYGHQNGDNVLIKVAEALQGCTKRPGDYAFRLGGEEFGVILSLDDKEKSKTHARKLIQSIEELHIIHEKNSASKYITASAGVVFKDYESDLNLDELYLRADNALYKAKENGRNQVVFD